MSSLPFRTAFWALGLSLMMTLMLMVPNPKKIRLALHAHREAAEFPFQETLITSLDHPESDIATVAEEPRAEAKPSTSDDATSPIEAAPVRVASADPTASIGYQPPPIFRKRLPKKEPKAVPVVEESPESKVAMTLQPAPAEESTSAQMEIRVPEPEDSQPIRTAAVPVEKPVEKPMPPVEEKPIETSVSVSVLEPLTQLKEPASAGNAPPFPGPAPTRPVPNTPAPVVELSNDSSMSITAGTLPRRWNFRFQGTQLGAVFKVLGQYQGYTVVVDDELSGHYSGQFLEADPAQAFAVLVKARDCRVSRRGNIILLTRRNADSLR